MKQFIVVLAVAALASLSEGACPRIVSRSEWGARPASTSGLTTFPPTHVVVHHAESPACFNQADCSALVRSFQNYHMDTNGWDDIGYNFLVGEDGNVYEGRGWGKTGAHAPNYNSKSIGICVIGSFTSSVPNNAAINALRNLVACGVDMGQISGSYKLVGHRQVTSTDCPGNAFYNLITSWNDWSPNP